MNLKKYDMKTIKIFAGLGNQIFQYAYGMYLEAQGFKVRYILSPTPGCITDVFQLPKDNIIIHHSRCILSFYKAVSKYIFRSYEVGFFQELRFVQDFLRKNPLTFKKEDTYKTSLIYQKVCSENSVSLHIRGGDYLQKGTDTQYGNVCTPMYYQNAIRYVQEQYPNAFFCVFTDDESYAQKILNSSIHKVIFISDIDFMNDPGFDLFMMAHCTHHIIANSTFSWWGAMLEKQKGLTLAPNKWVHDNSTSIETLIPNSWIIIKTDE